jgi:hypothetical protein
MHTKSRRPRAVTGQRLERAIVLQVLREDRGGWSSSKLESELGVEASTLDMALGDLAGAGVLYLEGDVVRPARATLRLDELGLLGI